MLKKPCRLLIAALFLMHVPVAMADDRFASILSPDNFIMQAVYAQGRLWVLTSGGKVAKLDIKHGTGTVSDLADSARALCSDGHSLWMLTTPGHTRTPRFMTLRVLKGGAWKPVTRMPFHYELFYGMSCTGGQVAVITDSHISTWSEGHLHRVHLSPRLSPTGNFGTLARAGNHTYLVGFNAGEFGGGLNRVDARTGVVHEVASHTKPSPHDVCGLLTGCDAINAIVAEPWNRHCMAIAIGVVHMMSEGRIVSVCPNGISLLFRKASGNKAARAFFRKRNKHGVFPDTVAIYGLIEDGDDLLAVSSEGLFRIDAHGHGTKLPFPAFRNVSGVTLSTRLPNAILVLTEMNRGHSLSGATPMLVPRTP